MNQKASRCINCPFKDHCNLYDPTSFLPCLSLNQRKIEPSIISKASAEILRIHGLIKPENTSASDTPFSERLAIIKQLEAELGNRTN